MGPHSTLGPVLKEENPSGIEAMHRLNPTFIGPALYLAIYTIHLSYKIHKMIICADFSFPDAKPPSLLGPLRLKLVHPNGYILLLHP